MVVTEIKSKEEFTSILSGENRRFVVVDFFALWCGPCLRFAPKYAEFSTKYSNDFLFLKVNVDEVTELADTYNVTSLPSFMFFDTRSKNRFGITCDTLCGADAQA